MKMKLKRMKGNSLVLVCLLLIFGLYSCVEESYTPKPKGYFKIELPEKSYQQYNDTCPFNFKYPEYSRINTKKGRKPCWFNIEFPRFKGVIHLSYKPVDNNIHTYLEDSRSLAYKHTIKAMDIEEDMIYRPQEDVYGMVYNIRGNTASSLQFFLTDSTDHFLRGALYFNVKPNKDSIKPVLNFVRKDVETLIKSFSWKNKERAL